jgi:hypothetical protein
MPAVRRGAISAAIDNSGVAGRPPCPFSQEEEELMTRKIDFEIWLSIGDDEMGVIALEPVAGCSSAVVAHGTLSVPTSGGRKELFDMARYFFDLPLEFNTMGGERKHALKLMRRLEAPRRRAA